MNPFEYTDYLLARLYHDDTFLVSFLLQFWKCAANTGSMKTTKLVTARGNPTPLGASIRDNGVNFAVFSQTEPTLCLFKKGELQQELELQQTGDIWHLFVEGIPHEDTYAYRVNGKLVIDPYSRSIRGVINPALPFDWEDDKHPNIPLKDLIIYEMHVHAFGRNFKGVEEKIPYLKSLGITAVELMPIFAFERETPFKNTKGKPLLNYWGYNTLNFFSLMESYGTIEEFKSMVKAFHKAEIEVYLDVVYNHTPHSCAFHELANDVYYMVDDEGNYLNFSGCGNTVNCNHPVVHKLIMDSLCYWVEQMHVDGFRFDLASILTRGPKGQPLAHPPLVEAICKNPLLAKTKMIAEPWDPGGLYQVGSFPGKSFLEYNGLYRDSVRRFLKGTDGEISNFATRICGSNDLYKTPTKGINFVTCHDGFTLRDLVSYNNKHNNDNGEHNNDGNSNNESWNCGTEGETKDRDVNKLRTRQMRNFIFTLMISHGIPMILMGDEYGRTKKGNNNSWAQGVEINGFDWHAKSPLTDFVRKMIQIRKTYFQNDAGIYWYGVNLNDPDWSAHSRFMAFTRGNLYIAINACYNKIDAKLPPGKWHCLVNTAELKSDPNVYGDRYRLKAHSSILLVKIEEKS